LGRLLAAELLKVRKRWLPYGLTVFMIAGAAFIIWAAGYGDWSSGDDFDIRLSGLHTFAFPYSIPSLLDSGQFWGSFFIGTIVASVVATEYNWGTVKQALIRGQSRTQFLAVKLVGLVIVCALSLLIVLAIGIGFSLIATSIAGEPITLDVPDGPSVPEIVLMVLRTGLAVVPYGLIAFCLAVVGRSTALGSGGLFAFMIAESIALAIFNGSSFLHDLRDFLPAHHVQSLIAANRIGPSDYNHLSFRELPNARDLPDPNIAALVLALYCVVFIAIAFYVFRRRDIRA
jgi:ABC-2 type transport system permease protein